MNVAVRSYVAIAHSLAALPHFRGKVRLGMRLYSILCRDRRHGEVKTTLRHPVAFDAFLDIHCYHERMAMLMSGYEPDTCQFLLRCFRGDGYYLDVGANIGLLAIPFALMHRMNNNGNTEKTAEEPFVYCFEPVTSNYRSLERNIALNGLQRAIKTESIALGECEKQVHINIEGDIDDGTGTGTAHILGDDATCECNRIPLEIRTLDRLVREGRLPLQCSLIKLDTDGYDLKVLQGASELLGRSRPVIFGEFMKDCLVWHGQSASQVATFCRQLEYAVFRRRLPAWTFSPFSEDGTFVQDLLLVPRERLSDFDWCCAT
jgi:FkbM family methyltransferase